MVRLGLLRDKDEAKALGALWDPEVKTWFVPDGLELGPFSRWSAPNEKKSEINDNAVDAIVKAANEIVDVMQFGRVGSISPQVYVGMPFGKA